jgi:hypothetical protein
MPSRSHSTPSDVSGDPPNYANLPDTIRAELLRQQAASITTPQRLPRARILPQGALAFQFTDTEQTVRSFDGVVVAHHPANILWDRPYGTPNVPENERFPACSASDGIVAVPREGFYHQALGHEATGDERIACATCPYNEWESARLIGRQGRGKACTNQRIVYLVTEDRQSPVQLTLSSTSIPVFDEYLLNLLNRGLPVQAVLTRFSQERKTRGTLVWSVVTYEMLTQLNQPTFDHVMDLRAQFQNVMEPAAARAATPTPATTTQAADAGTPDAAVMDALGADDPDDNETLPF